MADDKCLTSGLLAAVAGLLLVVPGCGRPVLRPSPALPVAPSPTPPAMLASLVFPALPTAADCDACRAPMRPSHEDECARLADLPRYAMALEMDPERNILKGRERITLVNRAASPQKTIVLRLYSNLPPARQGTRSDAGITIGGIRVNGQAAKFSYRAQNTAVEIRLPSPLGPRRKATIELDFVVQLCPDKDGVWKLASFYPMLAVYDGISWRLDVSPIGDVAYSESAFYTVYLAVPGSLKVAASGVEVAAVQGAGILTTHTYCTGPMRDFALAASERFQIKSREVDGVAVSIYYSTGNTEGEKSLDQASQALAVYNRIFGDYPYASFAVVLLPGSEGGVEYPGLVFISSYGGADIEFLVAHEVAHQWWYGVVGNDILREAWLDEAFAQYSAVIYMGERHGAEAADEALARERSSYQRLVQTDQDAPVGQAVWEFASDSQYIGVVYHKGAVFLDTLRGEVGDKIFFAILQEYYRRHKYGIAGGKDFLAVAQEVSGRLLSELYERWIGK